MWPTTYKRSSQPWLTRPVTSASRPVYVSARPPTSCTVRPVQSSPSPAPSVHAPPRPLCFQSFSFHLFPFQSFVSEMLFFEIPFGVILSSKVGFQDLCFFCFMLWGTHSNHCGLHILTLFSRQYQATVPSLSCPASEPPRTASSASVSWLSCRHATTL